MDTPHFMMNIHRSTLIYNFALIYIFVILAGGVMDILHGRFFRFGPPFRIGGREFGSNSEDSTIFGIYLLLSLCIQFLKVCRQDIHVDPHHIKEKDRVRERVIAIRVVDTLAFWQGLIYMYIVALSQVTFFLMIVAVDVCVGGAFDYYWIWYRMHDTRRNSDMTPTETEKIRQTRLIFSFAEGVGVIIILMTYIFTDTISSEYFSWNMPVTLIGTVVTNKYTVWGVAALIFVDQCIYGTLYRMVSAWITRDVKSPDACMIKCVLEPKTAVSVFFVVRIVRWARFVFSISFLTTRYYFILPYALGDIASVFLHSLYEQWLDASEKKCYKRKYWAILIASCMMVVEIVAIGSYLFAVNAFSSEYFDWPDAISIFGNVITERNQFATLFVFICLYQFGVTITEEIINVDMENWLYHGYNDNFIEGSDSTTRFWVVVANRLNVLAQTLIRVQFSVSSVYFIFFKAAIDIITSTLIFNKYVLRCCAVTSNNMINRLLLETLSD